MLSIIGVTLAGHYGASLTHGPDYLTEVLPWRDDDHISRNPDFNLTSFSNSSRELSGSQVNTLNVEVAEPSSLTIATNAMVRKRQKGS